VLITIGLSSHYEWEDHPESDAIDAVLAISDEEHAEAQARLAAMIEKAASEDSKELRRQIAELEAQVKVRADIDAARLSVNLKQDHTGTWKRKFVNEAETFLTVGLGEAEIQNNLEHFQRTGQFWPGNRAEVAAWYLTTKTLPHHAHPDHFTSLTVEDEGDTADVEAYLRTFFKVGSPARTVEEDSNDG
jgi:hypothetical protein